MFGICEGRDLKYFSFAVMGVYLYHGAYTGPLVGVKREIMTGMCAKRRRDMASIYFMCRNSRED